MSIQLQFHRFLCHDDECHRYVVGEAMTVEEAMAYHNPQVPPPPSSLSCSCSCSCASPLLTGIR